MAKSRSKSKKSGLKVNEKSVSYSGDLVRLRCDGKRVDAELHLGDGIKLKASKSIRKLIRGIFG